MANRQRGEYPLALCGASSGPDAEPLEFTVRLTFNGVCNATTRLSITLGREYTERDITLALVDGLMRWNVLRHLLFEAIKGQHGIRSVEDAGDLMERNMPQLLTIARTLADAFNRLFPVMIEGLADSDKDGAGGNPEGPHGPT